MTGHDKGSGRDDAKPCALHARPGVEGTRLCVIPAGTFIVACHAGSYQTISKTYRKLWNYIKKQGLTVTGNSVETSIINISMTNNPKEFVTEIQIPVEMP